MKWQSKTTHLNSMISTPVINNARYFSNCFLANPRENSCQTRKLLYRICILSFVLLLSLFFAGCSPSIPVDFEETLLQSTSTVIEDNTQSENIPEDGNTFQPFELEYVGRSSNTDAEKFHYYREMTTDVLYIAQRKTSGYAGMGGLTTVLDPETGLPLTFTRYMELYESKVGSTDLNSGEEDLHS